MVKLDRSNKQRAVLCATYPTAELSVVQRPWGFLFEVGMRFSFIKFNLEVTTTLYSFCETARIWFPPWRSFCPQVDTRMVQGGAPKKVFKATGDALAGGNITIFDATVLYGHLLARVDILQRVGDVLNLIEVTSSSIDGVVPDVSPFREKNGGIDSGWRPYLEGVSFQEYILARAFPALTIVPYLCVVDKSRAATANSTYDNCRLHRVEAPWPDVSYSGDVDALQHEHVLATVNVSDEVNELLPDLEPDITRFAKSLSVVPFKRIPQQLGRHCKGCEYRDGFRECWQDLADADPHVLDLYYIKDDLVTELVARGTSSLFDVPEDRLTGVRGVRQKIQLQHTRSGSEFIASDLPRLLKGHKYPLQFIDFEASRLALPFHVGMHPYETATFQWSCHTVEEPDGPLLYSEWLNTEEAFPNFDFARSLMKSLDPNGTTCIWSKFERSQLRSILRQYDEYGHRDPELRAWLVWITQDDIFVDMMATAKTHYFHPMMKGSLSIKSVLAAVWAESKTLCEAEDFAEYVARDDKGNLVGPYDTLPPVALGGVDITVREGMGAVRAYKEMVFAGRGDLKAKQLYAKLLRQYCKLDTNAMVMIWRHWCEDSGK